MAYRTIYKEDILDFVGNTEYCPSKINLVDGQYRTETNGNVTITVNNTINNDLLGIPDKKKNLNNGCYKVSPYNGIGCDENDYTGINYEINNTKYNICHSSPIQTFFNSIIDDPNLIVKFIKILFVSIFGLIILTIFGCCYEFWARYGDNINCFYYFSKKQNLGMNQKSIIDDKGSTSNKISLIDHIYPSHIAIYPYQKGSSTIVKASTGIHVGGAAKDDGFKMLSYEECPITHTEDSATPSDNRVFPYNLVDIVNKEGVSGYIKSPVKILVFSFLYTVLINRFFLGKFLKAFCSFYKNTTNKGKDATWSNAFFVLVSVILSPFMGIGFLIFISGLFSFLSFFIIPVIMVCNNVIGSVTIIDFFDYNKVREEDSKSLTHYYPIINPESFFNFCNIADLEKKRKTTAFYVSIFYILVWMVAIVIGAAVNGAGGGGGFFFWSLKLFFPINFVLWLVLRFIVYGLRSKPTIVSDLGDGLEYFCNYLQQHIMDVISALFLIFLIMVMCFLYMIGHGIGSVYMVLSIIFNFFRIPFKFFIELLNILRVHSDLLTILFCIGVIGSVGMVFTRNTTGIMSFILTIIILYKLSKAFNKDVK